MPSRISRQFNSLVSEGGNSASVPKRMRQSYKHLRAESYVMTKDHTLIEKIDLKDKVEVSLTSDWDRLLSEFKKTELLEKSYVNWILSISFRDLIQLLWDKIMNWWPNFLEGNLISYTDKVGTIHRLNSNSHVDMNLTKQWIDAITKSPHYTPSSKRLNWDLYSQQFWCLCNEIGDVIWSSDLIEGDKITFHKTKKTDLYFEEIDKNRTKLLNEKWLWYRSRFLED